MAIAGIMERFARLQPKGELVTAREFVDVQARLERSIDNIIKFASSLIPSGFHAWVELTSSEIALYFDDNGVGRPNKPFEGWAIMNGKGGRPDLDGKFIRASTTASGSPGGNDSSAHTHGEAGTQNGSMIARVYADATNDLLYLDHDSGNWTSAVASGAGTITFASANTALALGATVQGESAAASVTDNRPAHRHAVPIMRL